MVLWAEVIRRRMGTSGSLFVVLPTVVNLRLPQIRGNARTVWVTVPWLSRAELSTVDLSIRSNLIFCSFRARQN
jgi:hypothetical protein